MRTNFKAVTILVAFSVSGVVACHKSDDYKSPQAANVAPMAKPEDEIKLNDPITCDRSDDELTPYMAEASGRVVDVRDSIDTQEYEVRDCDGKITKGGGPQPVRNLKKKITVEPVEKYNGTVTAVSVGNYRTCVLRKFFVAVEAAAPAPVPAATEADGAEKAKVDESAKADSKKPKAVESKKSSETTVSHLDSSGKLEVVVTDETSKFGSDVNVRDGKNVIEVTYFGKCLEKDSSTAACKSFEKLGSQFVLVNVDVKRPQVGGVHTVEKCEKVNPAPTVAPEAPKAEEPKPVDEPKTDEPKADEPKSKTEEPKKPASKKPAPKKPAPKSK